MLIFLALTKVLSFKIKQAQDAEKERRSDVKITAKYRIYEATPMKYYRFLTRFALVLGSSINAFKTIALFLGEWHWLDALYSVGITVAGFVALALLCQRAWNGVLVLCGMYLFSMFYHLLCMFLFTRVGISVAAPLAGMLVMGGYAALNWVYFKKRRLLFDPPPELWEEYDWDPQPLEQVDAAPETAPQEVVFSVQNNFEVCTPPAAPNPPKKNPNKILSIVLACVLAVSLCGNGILGYRSIKSSADMGDMRSAVDRLTAENASIQQALDRKTGEANRMKIAFDETNSRLKTLTAHMATISQSVVFMTEGGTKYHRYECRYFQDASSWYAHNVAYAIYLGYRPCLECDPPTG